MRKKLLLTFALSLCFILFNELHAQIPNPPPSGPPGPPGLPIDFGVAFLFVAGLEYGPKMKR